LHAVALEQAHDDLAAAHERLREAGRRKDEFLGVLSHELRNPLAPIQSGLDLLARAGTDQDRARAQTIIRRQVDQLRRIVEDLLDATRIAGGKVRLQREVLDLADFARGALEDNRHAFDSAGVALRIHADAQPIRVNADPTRIAQAIGNLLQNAAKFT